MRLAMVAAYPAPGAAPVGGPEVAAARLVPAIARLGVDVTVVTHFPGQRGEISLELGERMRLLALTAADRWSLLTGLQPFRWRVRLALRRVGADLVHAQGLVPYGIAATEPRTLPCIVTAHGNMRADAHATMHSVGGISRAYLRDRLGKTALDRADVVIGVNPDWTVNLPSRPRRFVYIPNIVDERFYELERRPEPGLVLFLGGARAIKGWPLLAAAWPSVRSAVRDARLLVTGWPDGDPPHLEREEQSVAVERWLPPDEVSNRMAHASVLVIPSRFEVSPMVLGEAWALGLPVVATSVGGLTRLAEGAAVIVPRREPKALARAIATALAGGADVERLVEEGRRRVESHRANSVARAHVTLYDLLVQRSVA
jgi:glycosyltransferase involved in cell wall biosynthesis